jgi:transposase
VVRTRRGGDPLPVFVAVLGHSRAAYAECVTDERLASLLACHEAAFAFFGGTPGLPAPPRSRQRIARQPGPCCGRA